MFNVKKKQRNGFFIFCMRYTFTKQKVVVIEIPEWKLKAKLAKDTIFQENLDKIFAHFGSKIAKTDYFNGFNANWSVFKSYTW